MLGELLKDQVAFFFSICGLLLEPAANPLLRMRIESFEKETHKKVLWLNVKLYRDPKFIGLKPDNKWDFITWKISENRKTHKL